MAGLHSLNPCAYDSKNNVVLELLERNCNSGRTDNGHGIGRNQMVDPKLGSMEKFRETL